MELRQLSAFVAVADEGGFTRAAERLGVVQPAVSQAVGRLEDELEIVLFERSSRRVALTSAGEAFLPYARAVIDQLAHAERAAHELSVGRAGVVRLATTGGAWDLVHALLVEHRAAHPGVRVELQSPERVPKLRAILDGEIDAALVHTAPRTPGLSFAEVSSEPWHVVASAEHRLAGTGAIELRALAGDPLVLVAGERSGASRLRAQLIALCRGAGFEPTLGPVLASLEDALIEIAQSSGWTLLRAANVSDVGRVGVIELAVSDELPPARLWLAHRTHAAPATRSLVALATRLRRSGG
jgi:DNA-binding transcriptional LysR family regulator